MVEEKSEPEKLKKKLKEAEKNGDGLEETLEECIMNSERVQDLWDLGFETGNFGHGRLITYETKSDTKYTWIQRENGEYDQIKYFGLKPIGGYRSDR